MKPMTHGRFLTREQSAQLTAVSPGARQVADCAHRRSAEGQGATADTPASRLADEANGVRLTEEQYADLQRRQLIQGDHIVSGGRTYVLASKPKKSKFKNIRVHTDGQKFDSKWEHERFQQLKLLEAAGEIRDLKAQVSFPLMTGDELIGAYVADAMYFDVRRGRKVVEDAKGGKSTPLFRWKSKHFKAQYGFAITEVRKP